jgi:hypothetical protein
VADACVGVEVATACVAVGVAVRVAVAVAVVVAVVVAVGVAVAVLVQVAVAVAVASAACTTTVPDMLAPWTPQLYVYVPTVSNVKAKVSPDPERLPLLKLSGPLSDVTVWASESATVQVTVSPGFTVTEDVVGSDQDTVSSSARTDDVIAACRMIARARPAARVLRLNRWLIMRIPPGKSGARSGRATTRNQMRRAASTGACGSIERDRGLSLLPRHSHRHSPVWLAPSVPRKASVSGKTGACKNVAARPIRIDYA